MSKVLKLDGVTCLRGGVPVLSKLNMIVDHGSALILRGPNGSGKTTLLRSIAGLQPFADGTISVDRDDLIYTSHLDGVKPVLTVEENLRFWASTFGADSIEPALEAFDLQALCKRRAGALSAGQKRRLGLARLIVAQKKLWLCDEPTVSLDQTSVGQFANAVKAHLAKGGSAVLATHIDLGLEAEILDIAQFKADTNPVLEDWI